MEKENLDEQKANGIKPDVTKSLFLAGCLKQRQIKFRAWDSYQNKMLLWHDIFNPDSLSIWNLLNGFIDHIQPLQYTGLKDKNGKEIYEGDILAIDERKIIGYGMATAFIGYVKYSTQAGAYWIMSKIVNSEKERYAELSIGGQYGDERGIQLTSIEIIGNIFQDAEIIK